MSSGGASCGGYAAVGDDGARPVVWGLGETEEAALADARRWLTEALPDLPARQLDAEVETLELYPITAEQRAAIAGGAIAWPIRAAAAPAERDPVA